MRPGGVFRKRAKRRAVGERWQHCTGCEVRANAYNLLCLHAGLLHHLRHTLLNHTQIVARILQCPFVIQASAIRKLAFNHAVFIRHQRPGSFFASLNGGQHHTARFGAVINAYRKTLGHGLPQRVFKSFNKVMLAPHH